MLDRDMSGDINPVVRLLEQKSSTPLITRRIPITIAALRVRR